MKPRNVVVAQSGGPSPVINNSLRAIVETCRSMPGVFGSIYAGYHGIEGILKEELLDLSAQTPEEIALLRTTPAAGSIGTCRYKLKAAQTEDFERVIEVLRAHDIGYFFYIGGNDSMDTAHKVAALAQERGLDLVATGVPKTIDNDVGDSEFRLVDHTPGYGSTAPLLGAERPGGQRGERRFQPCRPRPGDPGDGAQDRLHPGRRRAWPTRAASCRCTSIWPNPA